MGQQSAIHDVQIARRPMPPSSRMRCSGISRAGFLGLIAAWSSALVLIFAFSALVRLVA